MDTGFRDPRTFRAVARRVLAHAVERRHAQTLRVWKPACGGGEQAYALAMTFMERRSGGAAGMRVIATDVDADNLREARRGIYERDRLAPLGARRMTRFFDAGAATCRITTALREQVLFAQHNIFSDVPFIGIDLICCDTLLRFVDGQLAERLFELLYHALLPGGHLLLHAQDPAPPDVDYEFVSGEPRLYRRLERSAQRRHVPFPIAPPAPAGGGSRRHHRCTRGTGVGSRGATDGASRRASSTGTTASSASLHRRWKRRTAGCCSFIA